MANISGWNPDTFSFSPEFQKQIIAAMIQEPKIFERLGILIDYRSFDIAEYAEIFKGIQDFYEEYHGMPTKEALSDLLSTRYHSETLNETLEEIYNHKRISTSTIEYIEDSIRNFISCQALKRAIYESIDDLGDPKKHPNVKERIEKALTIGASLDDFGIDAYNDEEILNRWQRRKNKQEIPRISTGWTKFDQVFGGFGIGEVFTFTGPAHSGKSMYLVNVGANVLLQKKNVLHITLEMSQEITAQRYDMRLLGLTKDELNSKIAIERLKEVLSNHIGRLIIKRYPSDTVTANDIATFIKRLEMVKDFVPDIIIIDYADIMRSTHHYNDRRFELDAIYNQVRNLGIEFKVPIVTATQLNRDSLERLEAGKILTEANIAESYGISRIIDCGVTINSTQVDSSLHHTSTIYVFKNRDGISGETWKMYVDFSRALVKEWSAPLISDITNQMKKEKRKNH